MAGRTARKLNDIHKAYVVQSVACYSTPKEVADALKEEYGVEVSPQTCESYNPTRAAGKTLAKKWRVMFEETRKRFLDHVEEHVPEANKAVRIKQLANAARAMKGRGNWIGMADMLERIAKELGNVHTNRREVTGRDGKAIEVADMSAEQVNAELVRQLGILGLSMADVGLQEDGAGEVRH